MRLFCIYEYYSCFRKKTVALVICFLCVNNRIVPRKIHTRYNANRKLWVADVRLIVQKGLYREWYAVLDGTVRNRKQEISEAKFL